MKVVGVWEPMEEPAQLTARRRRLAAARGELRATTLECGMIHGISEDERHEKCSTIWVNLMGGSCSGKLTQRTLVTLKLRDKYDSQSNSSLHALLARAVHLFLQIASEPLELVHLSPAQHPPSLLIFALGSVDALGERGD